MEIPGARSLSGSPLTFTATGLVGPVASVTVALAASSLTVGQTAEATATLRNAHANVISGASVSWTLCSLYRNTELFEDARLHVATFDAGYRDDEMKEYNRENCERARSLFQGQPGVKPRFWCEKGRFKEMSHKPWGQGDVRMGGDTVSLRRPRSGVHSANGSVKAH